MPAIAFPVSCTACAAGDCSATIGLAEYSWPVRHPEHAVGPEGRQLTIVQLHVGLAMQKVWADCRLVQSNQKHHVV